MISENQIAFESNIEFEIILKTNFKTMHDLAYILVDLQALFTGFFRAVEDYDIYGYQKEVASDIAEDNYTKEVTLKKVQELIDKNKNFIEEHEVSRIKKEFMQLIENSAITKRMPAERAYPTTSRAFNKKYKELVKLKSFQEGSLWLSIITTVLGGIILEFFRRLIFSDNKEQNMIQTNVVNNNTIIIVNPNDKTKSIKQITLTDNFLDERKKKDSVRVEDYINGIVNKVEYYPDDIEKSVKGLLKILASEGIINIGVLYDEKPIKTIVADVSRLKGNFLDIRI